MSAAPYQAKAEDYRLDENHPWANAWKVTAACGVLGSVLSVIGAFMDWHRFSFSYLFAFMTFLAIALGGIFFAVLQYLTSSGWSVTVRRVTEYLHWPVFVFALLFLPIAGGMSQLFPWVGQHGAEHGEPAHEHGADEHGHEHEHGHDHAGGSHGGEHSGGTGGDAHDPEHLEHAKILAAKVPYLNLPFFGIRAVLYFLAWILLSRAFFRNSVKQDEDGDMAWTVKSQRLAPIATLIMAFTATFAAFDWMMSLEPSWFSTIFGVNFFASCIVTALATTIIIAYGLQSHEKYAKVVNKEHFHDLGKLLFGFLVFWAYVNFSQLMLIWYASVPEETTYYHRRWFNSEGWTAWSTVLIFGHFLVPFFLILSRNAKRAIAPLQVGAAVILVFHVAFTYWLVMPYATPGELSPHWMDVACLFAVGGIYLTLVLRKLNDHPLIPIKDPRLSRAINFQNA